MNWHMLHFNDLQCKPLPDQLFSFAGAYLESAETLCKKLCTDVDYSSPQSQDRIWVKLSFLFCANVYHVATLVESLGKWPISEGFLNKPARDRPLSEGRVA